MVHDTREAMRIRKQRERLRNKLEAENKDPDDLNFGMKPIKDIFPDFEEYQEFWAKQGIEKSQTDWLKAKLEWDRETVQNEQELLEQDAKQLHGVLNLMQYNPKCRNKCIEFRNAFINGDSNLGVIHQNHNCPYCDKWLEQYKKTQVINGIDLWGFEC